MEKQYADELLKSQLEIQEQTFRSISLEIHDNIGQVLSLAKLNMGIMGQQTDNMPMLEDTRDLLGKAINDLRDLSKSLSPERVADIDLAESIQYELQRVEKTGLYRTTVDIKGKAYPLPKEKKIILFRIFQEVMNNTVKHAAASSLQVTMHYNSSTFELQIVDNGKGFNIQQEQGNIQGGIGLRNMQNRSTLIGAAFQIHSGGGAGTTVNIILPVPESV
ncbi:MAG: ATP-binding protein [Bacteroidota bacterium]